MARNHGARQQKRAAKHQAKRNNKRQQMRRASSNDPTILLEGAAKWAVVEAMAATRLWEDGLGAVILARKAPRGKLAVACLLVDVFCLGVKKAHWYMMTPSEFRDYVADRAETNPFSPIAPQALVKLVQDSVAYAGSLGFPPDSGYQRTSMLFAGIDPGLCDQTFTFGYEGKPLYVRGPSESHQQMNAIARRVKEMGGNVMLRMEDDDFDSASNIRLEDMFAGLAWHGAPGFDEEEDDDDPFLGDEMDDEKPTINLAPYDPDAPESA